MLAILDTDDLSAVRELEQLRIEATRQNDADVLGHCFTALLRHHRRESSYERIFGIRRISSYIATLMYVKECCA